MHLHFLPLPPPPHEGRGDFGRTQRVLGTVIGDTFPNQNNYS